MDMASRALVNNVGQLLTQLVTEEYRLLSGLRGDVTEVRLDLGTMHALLRMESEAGEGAADHFVGEWMNQLRELAYDAEDFVDLYKLRRKPRSSGSNVVTELWFGLKHWLETTIIERRRLARQIRAIRDRAINIGERHARYGGIDRDALRSRCHSFAHLDYDDPTPAQPADDPTPAQPADDPTPAQPAPNTPACVFRRWLWPWGRRQEPQAHPDDTGQFVDVGGHAESLTRKLLEDPTNTFKVFFVVGFGGVGKTTLAMEVCRRLQTEFPYQAMVSVSQAFEPSTDAVNKLLESICDKIVKLRSNDSREAINHGNLGKYLSDKRYLIVIDDVWTVHAWEAIQLKLQALQNNCGSRILVTTRIRRVAEVFSSDIYSMKALEKEDSKNLFCKKVFGSTKDDVCPDELVPAMNNIIEKCGGMALAIVSIASILESYKSNGDKDKWEKVYKSIGSDLVVGNNPQLERMRHIVALSYNHLPHELKGCMMYLSIFPEDYEIDKKRLMSRWIAEGLVPEKRGWTQMEVAEDYLDELVSRNMVIPHYGYDDEKVESCRVHDILLEILVSKSRDCNFVSLLGGQHTAKPPYDRIRRLSIQGTIDETRPQGGMELKHVRSLSMFQVNMHTLKLLADDLSKFTLLRVLDLEGCEGLTIDHMNQVCKLYLLRFLSVKGTNIEN
ncbi:unnamed protein product [Urochloa humidicola]